MDPFRRIVLLPLLVALLAGCSPEPPPVDGTGRGPDAVLLETYRLILDGDLAAAKETFDPRLLAAVFPPTGPATFESHYAAQTAEWRQELLTTEIVGNDYSEAVWRVRISSDDGTGRAGAMQDLAIIDGRWKIVFWGDYPAR